MAESKAKVIERNRAPRVQIAYDVEHYGSPTTIELPFVMGVMADLAGASETAEATKPVRDRAFVEVDAGRFPKFMEALAPRVKARVRNTLPRADGAEAEEELAVDLSFRSMGDFSPDKVAEQVPPLAELERMDDDAVVEALTGVRGIGEWTVQMLLIFQLGRTDVFPVADVGVRRGFELLLGLDRKATPAEMLERAERWSPYRSVAAWYLWRALEVPGFGGR